MGLGCLNFDGGAFRFEAESCDLEPHHLLVLHPQRPPFANTKVSRDVHCLKLAPGCLQKRLRIHKAFNCNEASIERRRWAERPRLRDTYAEPVAVHIQRLARQLEKGADLVIRQPDNQPGGGSQVEASLAEIPATNGMDPDVVGVVQGRDKAIDGGVQGVAVVNG